MSPPDLWSAAGEALRDPVAAVGRLREGLRSWFDADQVVLIDSGTQALQLALQVAADRVGVPRPPVALPAYACFDVATAAVGADLPVLFYDVDPTSLTPDPESVTRALGAGARILVAANLFAFPLDWDWLRGTCREHGVILIEDAAQGLGARWADTDAGRFGDLTVLSFSRGKGWTGGRGGALLARGPAGADPIDFGTHPHPTRMDPRGMQALASLLGLWLFGRPGLYRLPTMAPGAHLGETLYRAPGPIRPMPGFVAAAVSQARARALEDVEVRRAWGAVWRERSEADAWPGAGVHPCVPLGRGEAGYLRFPVVTTRASAAELAGSLEHVGVARSYPVPLPMLPQLEALVVDRGPSFPGASVLADGLLTCPTHARVDAEDVRVVSARIARSPA